MCVRVLLNLYRSCRIRHIFAGLLETGSPAEMSVTLCYFKVTRVYLLVLGSCRVGLPKPLFAHPSCPQCSLGAFQAQGRRRPA